MNDALIKIQFGISLIIVLILVILLFAARAGEKELRNAVGEMQSKMSLLEKKLDAISAAVPPPRR